MIPLTPEQENEVREAANKERLRLHPERYEIAPDFWASLVEELKNDWCPITAFRSAYAIAKGWHKQEGK